MLRPVILIKIITKEYNQKEKFTDVNNRLWLPGERGKGEGPDMGRGLRGKSYYI